MKGHEVKEMNQRLNIILPDEVVRKLDSFAPKGQRSKKIAEALTDFFEARDTKRIRAEVELEAEEWSEIDREVAEEWFALPE